MRKLLQDEKILEVVSPHPVSFWPYYVFFLYYIIVGGYMYAKYDEFLQSLMNTVGIELLAEILLVAAWWLILIIPAIIFSLLQISSKWAIFYVLIAVIGTYALKKQMIALGHIWLITMGVGVLGFILTESYRRTHKYIVTNKRIIMGKYMGIFGAHEREILYSKIEDLILQQGFLGKLLNYGTIIPTAASGLGTGVDVSRVSAGAGVGVGKGGVGAGAGITVGGERGVVAPRGRSWFILYGVPDPQRIYDLIFSQMHEREAAQYLQKQVELLEELVSKKKEEK
ncbi:MAG: PH domain-containing protein [Crenarchaeota archaeon]|nr:PH domain-containing protein [Thermoproteota archaeon]MCR8455404.1 PH domain-containing protein [Thermoproteota archaeon]MCR8501067.1 PH domain-containing protein [Thermoproteota archaeon]